MNSKIKFIGTGSGQTSLNRFHSSILFSYNSHNLLVDAGDGISKALLHSAIQPNEINSILITHTHADHFSGIASLITQMKISNRKIRLEIFIHEEFTGTLENFLNDSYLFKNMLGFELIINGYSYDSICSPGDGIKIIAKKNSHIVNRYKLDIAESRFQSASVMINLGELKIFYSSDIGKMDDLFLFEKESPQIVISEGTHITLKEIAVALGRLAPGKFIITHIPDEREKEFKNFAREIDFLPKTELFVATDGLEFVIGS